MITVNQEVADPQTKILFKRMSDYSVLLEIPGEFQKFSKTDFVQCDRELNVLPFTKEQVIEAFERVEEKHPRKRFKIINALDGFGEDD